MPVAKTAFACLVSGLLFLPQPIFAQQDIKGSKDHPLVGRFAGSTIRVYEEKEFDEHVLGLGKLTFREQAYRWSRSEKLEGKITRITYVAPVAASPVAIIRSYEEALKKAGFEILFAGDDQELGNRYNQWYDRRHPDPKNNRAYLLPRNSRRYLAGKLARPDGDIYTSVYVGTGSSFVPKNPTIQIDVVEIKPLERGLVTAEKMADALATTGRVAIYTIHFDTGKADIKPESEQTIKEIAKLIQQHRSLKLYVVGHTDNAGALGYNVDLSQRRAESVMKTLTARHGVEPERLHSAGVGPLAPVAPNNTEDGRAKNRRVELVAQ